ncbi:semaphorin-2A-like isoform X1 [Asterias rubens]|uniref:semaphorin-2A-like isoform X1 n=1 Tax=Asterias rubens TaxID=7604 RepID=UPI001455942D|nr:semaphorin-2A-like isoform X1 [Asterias rubens]
MSVLRHPSLRLLCILVFNMMYVCQSQFEKSVRRVSPPYPSSFNISQINGAAITFGPEGSENDGKFYRTLTLLDNKLFVGGNTSLFSARTQDLQTLDSVSIPKQPELGWSCDEKYCNNFIRVIQPVSDDVLLECGTNSFRPYCQQRSSQNLSKTIGSPQKRSFVAPSVAHQNSSWLLLNDSVSGYQIFAGTNLENSLSGKMAQLGIVKANLEVTPTEAKIDNVLTTKKHQDYVLNGPQFVGDPIEYNDNIYFFYREFSAEHINAGKILYSRVARICKSEGGGDAYMSFENNFVTFMKARLECSIAGDHPYHYNQIQDIYQSTKDENVVFAVFATGPSGVASSALCAYRLDEMEFSFENNPFKAQVHGDVQNLWLTVRKRESEIQNRKTCPAQTSFSNKLYLDILLFGQLLDKTMKSKLHYKTKGTEDSNPLLIASGERFTQIVVDEDVNSVDVFFIGTENGTVLKAHLGGRSEARIAEEISLNTNGVKKPVLTMLKSDADQAVFVGTDVGVYKVPFQHCQDYTSAEACRHPYCDWNNRACINSTANREPDSIGNEDSNKKERIAIFRKPEDQTRFPNKPVHLNLVARALKGTNLNVDGETILCTPCSSLPFTKRKSVSSKYEFLLLSINGTSAEQKSCACTWFLATGDGKTTATGTFNLAYDNSDKQILTPAELKALKKYDQQVLIHLFKQKRWRAKMINQSKMQDLQQHLRQCHGGNIYSQSSEPPFHLSGVLD